MWVFSNLRMGMTSGSSLWWVLLLLTVILTGSRPLYAASDQRDLYAVLLIGNRHNPFWLQVEKQTHRAARQLGIELDVINLDDNPLRPVRALSAMVNASRKPDIVLFPNIKNTGKPILELLEQHQVRSIIYDNGFAAKDNMGTPGQFYRYWSGEIRIGNYEASRYITHQVAKAALRRYTGQRPLPMIVLEGNTASQANSQRLLGMFDALVQYQGQIRIDQIFHTRYDPEHAYHATLTALQRYPDIRIIWSANDAMTLRVLDALNEQSVIPGQDLLITSFDRIPAIQPKVRQGAVYNSAGGHEFAAAWGLIYGFDLLHNAVLPYRQIPVALCSARTTDPAPCNATDNPVDFTRYSRLINPADAATSSDRYTFEAAETR